MFKVVWFARFPAGVSKDEGRRYWAEHHGPLAVKTGIERYVQNHVLGPVPSSGGGADETFFDGYSVGWWRDRAAFDATLASAEWQAVADDGANAFDMTWLEGMSAQLREHTVIEGTPGPFKVVWVCRFKEGMDRAEADRHWQQVHGPIFEEVGEIDRYVQNHVAGPLDEASPPGFDGFSECWFRDEERFRRALESDAWARAVADTDNFLDPTRLWGAVLRERVVKWDGEAAAA
jgi:uncharacterized protein (TIGR02118 family)